MAFENVKVYFDGSHYIAIPYKANPNVKKSSSLTDLETDGRTEAFEKAYKGAKTDKKQNENQSSFEVRFSLSMVDYTLANCKAAGLWRVAPYEQRMSVC